VENEDQEIEDIVMDIEQFGDSTPQRLPSEHKDNGTCESSEAQENKKSNPNPSVPDHESVRQTFST